MLIIGTHLGLGAGSITILDRDGLRHAGDFSTRYLHLERGGTVTA